MSLLRHQYGHHEEVFLRICPVYRLQPQENVPIEDIKRFNPAMHDIDPDRSYWVKWTNDKPASKTATDSASTEDDHDVDMELEEDQYYKAQILRLSRECIHHLFHS